MYSQGHDYWKASIIPHPGHRHTFILVINVLAYKGSWIPKYIARASRFAPKLRFATLYLLASLALFATRIFYILHIFAALNVFALYR